jgi:hypothetical protein
MACLFTTTFSYSGRAHTAVVSITGVDRSAIYSIFLPDESLHEIIPGGRISYNPSKGISLNYPNFSAAQILIIAVMISIEEYQIEKQNLPGLEEQKRH